MARNNNEPKIGDSSRGTDGLQALNKRDNPSRPHHASPCAAFLFCLCVHVLILVVMFRGDCGRCIYLCHAVAAAILQFMILICQNTYSSY